MKFSWKWLNQLIDLNNLAISDLAKQLTLCGFEIENTNLQIQDITIDININANRPDMTSMVGLTREISNLFYLPLNYKLQIQNPYDINKIDSIETNNLILRSSNNRLIDIKINTITNIVNTKSPKWLRNYLTGCDIESKNCLEDISQYIQHKWGQDIKIFDAHKIDKHRIKPSQIYIENCNDTKDILNLKSHNDQTNVDILKYKNKPILILGIELNKRLKCNLNTSAVIICASICESKYVMNVTKTFNIKTDISNKHIKKILRCDFLNAYNETLQLIGSYNKGTISKSYEYHMTYHKPLNIEIKNHTIQNILGPIKYPHNRYKYIETNKINIILKQLNLRPIYNQNKKTYSLTIPNNRKEDLKRPIDVIEEIGRIYGFEKLVDQLPLKIRQGQSSITNKITQKIRSILRNNGLHEVIHYSLRNYYKQKEVNRILIQNPLKEELSTLRYNLIENLITTAEYNIKQKNCNPEIFEIGKIFAINNNSKSCQTENKHLAGLIGNKVFLRHSWLQQPQSLSWFQAKGFLEDFFEKLHAEVSWEQGNNSKIYSLYNRIKEFFNSKRTAIIYNKNTKEEIGIFGEINKNLKRTLNVQYPIYIFEININSLIKNIKSLQHLNYIIKPYSTYPSVTRDISIILNPHININVVIKKILHNTNSLVESIDIFNEYINKAHKRSISLRIIYRAKDRTLTNKDIKNIDNEIKYLLNKCEN